MRALKNSSRRDFLKTSAALSGTLMVGFSIPVLSKTPTPMTSMNGWVRVGTNNLIKLTPPGNSEQPEFTAQEAGGL